VADHASKRCRMCGEAKPLGQFTRDRSKRDGHRNSCRDCEHERDRQRYQENREAKLAYQERYYQANGEAVRDYQRRYREANPEKIRERDRRYNEANREKIAEWHRQYEDANREKINGLQRRRAARYRAIVLGHYGQVCACPGCYSTQALGIDHIDGTGRQHRQELFGDHTRGGVDFHYWLIKNNFPPGYQTLCSRCNTSKGSGDHCWLDHDLEYDAENDAW